MTEYLQYLVTGLLSGSVYGLAAMGLVLTYKTSGIFNFAHGSIAALAAYLFYELHDRAGMPSGFAVVLVFATSPVIGALLERLARVLAPAGTSTKIVATVGVLVGTTGLLQAHYGAAAIDFPPFLPQDIVRIAGVNITHAQLITAGIALVGAVSLFLFFKVHPLGVQMRAVVDDPDLLELAGTSARRVRMVAWSIGSAFAGVSGLLLAPVLNLDAGILTLLVVTAFGAAAVGAFDSLLLTYVGGLLVGVASEMSGKLGELSPTLIGVKPSLPFLVLFAVLLTVPARRLVQPGIRRSAPVPAPLLPSAARPFAVGGFLAVGIALPFLVGSRLPVFTATLVLGVVFYSLNLLVRTSGQVSLCHATFVAAGAAEFANLQSGAHLPWLLAVAITGLLALPLGALVAIPAIRLSGVYLALATFGFALVMQRLVFSTDLFFGLTGQLAAHRPRALGLDTDKGFYYLCLLALALAAATIAVINRSRLGLLLRGLADAPTTLATMGLSVNVTRVAAFCVSAMMAAIAGAFYACVNDSVSVLSFDTITSLTWLAVLVLAGRNQLLSPLVAALLLVAAPAYITNETLVAYLPGLFGIGCIAAACVEARLQSGQQGGATGGMDAVVRRDRLSSRLARRSPVRSRVVVS